MEERIATIFSNDYMVWFTTYLLGKGFDKFSHIFSHDKFKKSISDAVSDVIKELNITNEGQRDSIEEFLKTSETFLIIRQLYSSILLGESSKYRKDIIDEFTRLLAIHLGIQPEKIRNFSEKLLQVYTAEIEKTLADALQRDNLSTKDFVNQVKTGEILDTLKNIQKNLDFLVSEPRIDINEIKKFEKEYRSQVEDRHKLITIPNYDISNKVPIDKIFIEPSFIVFKQDNKILDENLSFSKINR